MSDHATAAHITTPTDSSSVNAAPAPIRQSETAAGVSHIRPVALACREMVRGDELQAIRAIRDTHDQDKPNCRTPGSQGSLAKPASQGGCSASDCQRDVAYADCPLWTVVQPSKLRPRACGGAARSASPTWRSRQRWTTSSVLCRTRRSSTGQETVDTSAVEPDANLLAGMCRSRHFPIPST